MVLIKKDFQTLKMLRRDVKGDFIIVLENSVARGTIIKSSMVLSKKEFDDMLESADKLMDDNYKSSSEKVTVEKESD